MKIEQTEIKRLHLEEYKSFAVWEPGEHHRHLEVLPEGWDLVFITHTERTLRGSGGTAIVAQYVLGKKRDKVIEELLIRAVDAENRGVEAQEERNKAQTEMMELSNELNKEKEKHTARQNEVLAAYEQRDDLKEANLVFENDIGKIRAAIGDDRMKEILGRG